MNPTIHILYATQTGTAEELAEQAVKDLQESGLEAAAVNLSDFSVDQLSELQNVLVIAATWGEGEPPDDCVDFSEAFFDAEGLELKHLQYAVLALGDTAYDDFCKYGKDLDETFERHGAVRLKPRVDCDLDQDERYPEWIREVAALLAARTEPMGEAQTGGQPATC